MFTINEAIEILKRTPNVLEQLLDRLPTSWTQTNEGRDTWSPFDIVGHLIHGEETDWIDRTKLILEESSKPFIPFNREAQFENSKGKSISQLLAEFRNIRVENLEILKEMKIDDNVKIDCI